MRTNETFEQHLRKSNLSENTIHSYLWTVDFYHAHYDEVNKENLLAYKDETLEEALAEERTLELESELEQDEHPRDYDCLLYTSRCV